jgi:DNA-binding NarL/FixJ family response regulator
MSPTKPRALIVDDHELMRRGIERAIEEAGACEVCGEAANGVEAIAKVSELKPDLVLLDLSMPVMGGFEAASHIRKIMPAIKIVIVTMHESIQIAELAKQAGAQAFITKTEVSAKLIETIRRVFANE